jgi:hypothetical protein
MKKCPFCAEMVQDEAVVCRYCGREILLHQLSQAGLPSVPKKPTPLPIPMRIALAVSIAVCIIGGAYYLVWSAKEAKVKANRPVVGEYSQKPMQQISDIVVSFSKTGLIRQVDVASRTIYVDRSLWESMNVNEKTKLAQLMADHIGIQGKCPAYVHIKDYQSGKEMAEYDYAGYSNKE